MTEIQCRAVLFDMDGVLIDSTPAVERVWRRWAIAHGFDPEEVVRESHGKPSIATLREYLPGADHEAENRLIECEEMEDLEGVTPLPGALKLLSSLPIGRWAIVTSCTRRLADVRIRAAGLPSPPLIVTSSDVTHGKPHPEPYLKAAAELGREPQACIVVEDAPAGICAGKAAGSRVIAVRTTFNDIDSKQTAADWIVDGCHRISVVESAQGILLHLLDPLKFVD